MDKPTSDVLPKDIEQSKKELVEFLNAHPTLKHIHEEAEARRQLLDERQREIEKLEDGLCTIEEEIETLQEAYKILSKSHGKKQKGKKGE